MPEYPDITVYIERLDVLCRGQRLEDIRLASPFLMRTADPPLPAIKGLLLDRFERLGKRIIFCFENDFYLLLHLMIAGRLHWHEQRVKIPGKIGLAALDFASGTLVITEAGTQKRASLHLVSGRQELERFDAGGLEIFNANRDAFRARLLSENHTLKRALTDPKLFSGIGNAYSDEILHHAGLSPVQLTHKMDEQQIERLYRSTRQVMTAWTERLRSEAGDGLPEKVTAFRQDMAVHGRYGKPCPACGTAIQRIRYASNETNYCPNCQTGGKLLADRALSRLLKNDWPRTLEEMEELKQRRK